MTSRDYLIATACFVGLALIAIAGAQLHWVVAVVEYTAAVASLLLAGLCGRTAYRAHTGDYTPPPTGGGGAIAALCGSILAAIVVGTLLVYGLTVWIAATVAA